MPLLKEKNQKKHKMKEHYIVTFYLYKFSTKQFLALNTDRSIILIGVSIFSSCNLIMVRSTYFWNVKLHLEETIF